MCSQHIHAASINPVNNPVTVIIISISITISVTITISTVIMMMMMTIWIAAMRWPLEQPVHEFCFCIPVRSAEQRTQALQRSLQHRFSRCVVIAAAASSYSRTGGTNGRSSVLRLRWRRERTRCAGARRLSAAEGRPLQRLHHAQVAPDMLREYGD